MPRTVALGQVGSLFASCDLRRRTADRHRLPARRRLRVEALEDRRLLSIQPLAIVNASLVGDAAGVGDTTARLSEGKWAVVSDDARWVAFTSDAPNLVSGQVDARRVDALDNHPNVDVFLFDRQTGAKTLVSHQVGKQTTTANGVSVAMGISADGRYVLFGSKATNLVLNQVDTNEDFDVFLFDKQDGSVQLVSHSSAGAATAGKYASSSAVLSADGSFVAFASEAIDLVNGQIDGNGASDVFLWQRTTNNTGNITLVSRVPGSDVTTASGQSRAPSISNNGQSVAFVSDATGLDGDATDGNGASDIFLFDYATHTNHLVSHDGSASLASAAGASGNPAISGDGQYVAYESGAGNVVAGQAGPATTNVFLFSRGDGAYGTNQVVSAAGGNGTTTGSGASTSPVIGSGGRYVAFVSAASNLVPGQSGGGQSNIFLFDRGATSGGPSSIRLVSHNSGSLTTTASGASNNPWMSDDGRWIAYSSQATDLIANLADDNNASDVFLYDATQASGSPQLLSRDASAATWTGNRESKLPVVAASGSAVVVAYLTDASNLVAGKRDDNQVTDLVLYQSDATSKSSLVTLRDPGMPPVTGDWGSLVNPNPGQSVVSADGRFVVFSSSSTNLVAGQDTRANSSVFLYDALLGTVQLVSHSFESSTTTGNGESALPTISADGRYVAFVSEADNLVQNQDDGNNSYDVFLFDREASPGSPSRMRLVSHAAGSSTRTANQFSESPVISADGRYVAFASAASNLASGVTDTAGLSDIFLFDRDATPGSASSLRLVSHAAGSAAPANGASSVPLISAKDGRVRIAFLSQAINLVANGKTGGNAGQNDAFLYDLAGNSTQLVSHVSGSSRAAGHGEVVSAVLSGDGQYVAFASQAPDLVPNDTNGDSDVFLYLPNGSLQLVSHGFGQSTPATGGSFTPAVSGDGRYLAFASTAPDLVQDQIDTTGFSDIFLYDRDTGLSQLVSHTSQSPLTAGDALSEAPVISADGRFVAYSSSGSKLVTSMVDRNGASSDVFRFDRLAGASQLVSHTAASALTTGEFSSQSSGISGDGRSVVFRSYASDLVVGDYNRVEEAFVSRDRDLTNQAPSLAAVPVSFGAIDQDITSEANVGTAVDDLVATPNFYSDPNGTPPAGIAVTGQAATNGRWEYSTDGGPWTPFAAVSDASATLLWADGGGRSRIRFQPNATSGSTGSLTFRAWDGSDGRLNGATGVNIASTGGTAAYSSQHPTAAITVRPVEDSTPPTASLNAPNVTTAGTTYVFTVKYTDDRAVNVSTLDSADVRVAGLNNTFSQLATFDHVDPTGNGAERTATYRITPPGGSWSAANNGTYTVSLQAGQVADTAGNAAAASTLGTFVVDTVAPSVPSSSAASVRIAGRTSYTFTVTYADNIAVKGSTIGNGDVRVTGPKRFSQSATLVAVDAGGDGKRRTATYRITPPGGKWDAGDNGTYSVWMVPNQVSDTLGTFVAGRKLRTFSVNAAPDRVAPKAALSAPSLTTPTTANYFFTVTYTDNVELNWRTLDSRDVLVTGPKGFKTLATLDHVDVQANGPRRTATYRIAPPGGSWDAADSGTYTVTMQPNQVKDTSGRAVPSGRLGTFAVRVPAASPTAFSAGAALATSLDQRALLAAAADAAFASASEPQSRDRWSR